MDTKELLQKIEALEVEEGDNLQAGSLTILGEVKKYLQEQTKDYPVAKDLSQWVNETDGAVFFLYDLGLLPEEIRTRPQAAALRGFQAGWKAKEFRDEAQRKKRQPRRFRHDRDQETEDPFL